MTEKLGRLKEKQKDDEHWLMPPKLKILEALGTIADERITIKGNTASVESSAKEKIYSVTFDGKNSITSNDNGSFYKGYLGYPSIAFLMLKGILSFDKKISDSLKEIEWKNLNEKFKNYVKVETIIKAVTKRKGVLPNEIDDFSRKVMDELKKLNLQKLKD